MVRPSDGTDDPSLIAKILRFFATTPSALLFANPILLQIIHNIPFTLIQESLSTRNLDIDPILIELNASLEIAEAEGATV